MADYGIKESSIYGVNKKIKVIDFLVDIISE